MGNRNDVVVDFKAYRRRPDVVERRRQRGIDRWIAKVGEEKAQKFFELMFEGMSEEELRKLDEEVEKKRKETEAIRNGRKDR